MGRYYYPKAKTALEAKKEFLRHYGYKNRHCWKNIKGTGYVLFDTQEEVIMWKKEEWFGTSERKEENIEKTENNSLSKSYSYKSDYQSSNNGYDGTRHQIESGCVCAGAFSVLGLLIPALIFHFEYPILSFIGFIAGNILGFLFGARD